jgi:hypothetical protein
MLLVVSIFGLMIWCGEFVSATSYYISPFGSDSNSGTSPSFPWISTANANRVQYNGGDAVLFLGGVDHTPGGLAVQVKANSSGVVLISSYSASLPINSLVDDEEEAARIHVDGSLESAITISDSSNVEISFLSIFGLSGIDSAQYAGVAISSYNDSLVANNRFENIYLHDIFVAGFLYGINIYAAGCTGFSSVLVERVNAASNSLIGISSAGPYTNACYAHRDITVTNCTAFNNTGNPYLTSRWSGSGIVLSNVDGAVITQSLAYENGLRNGHVGGGPCGIWAWNSNNVTISHCVAHSNHNGGTLTDPRADGGGFDLDGGTSNSVITNCLSFNNAGPGYLVCQFGGNVLPTVNNTISYSVSYNDTLLAVNTASGLNLYSPDGSMCNTLVTGNTFFANGSSSIVAQAAGDAPFRNTMVTNNAFISFGAAPFVGFPAPPSGINFSGNAYWSVAEDPVYLWDGSSYRSLADFRSASGQEKQADGTPTGTDADPDLSSSTFFQVSYQY